MRDHKTDNIIILKAYEHTATLKWVIGVDYYLELLGAVTFYLECDIYQHPSYTLVRDLTLPFAHLKKEKENTSTKSWVEHLQLGIFITAFDVKEEIKRRSQQKCLWMPMRESRVNQPT